ncbi:MAG: PorV/PorQ family protein [Spirochaetes bacterium]|nr:PorV/PorQ family protein [Spirochaetota bacterium]
MRRNKGVFIICLFITTVGVLSAGPLFAEESDAIFQFIKISPSPSVAAGGNANVSFSEDAASFYYNPALSVFFEPDEALIHNPDTYELFYIPDRPFLRKVEFYASFIKYFESLNYASVFSTFLLKNWGRIGVGFTSLFYDDINRTVVDETGNYSILDETINLSDYCFLLNWSRSITERFGAGINLKLISETLHTSSVSSFAGDIGLIYKHKRFSLGGAVLNIGPKVKFRNEEYDLPLLLRIGGHYNILTGKSLISTRDKVYLLSKIEKGVETEWITSFGLEYAFREMLFLRAGYQLQGNDDGFNIGLGLKYNNYKVDYAFNSYDELGIVHRIGAGFYFESQRSSELLIDPEDERLFKSTKRGKEVGVQSDVLFEKEKAEIKKESHVLLDRIISEVKVMEDLRVLIIEGNTDGLSGKSVDLKLSEKRANTVLAYFAEKGINRKKMKAVGLGTDNPIAENETESGRRLNRRVDIVILRESVYDTIREMINVLPKMKRKDVEQMFYFGLDKYYKDDLTGAIELWKSIKTDDQRLNDQIKKEIKKVQGEMEQK